MRLADELVQPRQQLLAREALRRHAGRISSRSAVERRWLAPVQGAERLRRVARRSRQRSSIAATISAARL